MKDGELRGLVLKKFYEVRNHPQDLINPTTLPDLDSINHIWLFNICEQLREHKLLRWVSHKSMTTVGGMGHISAAGVDVVEGTVRPPITVIFHDHSISISQSANVQIGNSNSITQTGFQPGDLAKLVLELSEHLHELGLDVRQGQRAEAQIATLKTELEGEPDPTIVSDALRSLRSITEGAIGSLLASATQPTIWGWIHQALTHLVRPSP